VIGDAWLPQYNDDYRGTNIVVTRSAAMEALVRRGIEEGAVEADPLTVADVVASQNSGLRHRREGLAHRLAVRLKQGKWVPQKRVAPCIAPTAARRIIYHLRQRLAERSSLQYAAVRRGSNPISAYRRRIAIDLVPYKIATKAPALMRRLRRLIFN
jgi:hypothetical protein